MAVDRTTFPSDTISTHVIHPPGVAALNRWGLLDEPLPTGCPPVGTYAFDFGPFTIAGSPGTDDSPVAYAPRRTVLDKLLIDAAASAGAEVRQGFTVQEGLTDGGRVPNYLRQPYSPGWALVGDAGYSKDFITAQGISDAFRDADLCATALDQALSGTCSFGEAMSRYQADRDEHVLPMYEFTTQLATLQPPPEDSATSPAPFTATKRPWTASHGPTPA